MNSNRRVVTFTVTSFILYAAFSLAASVYHFKWPVFNRINLIADVFAKDSTQLAITDSAALIDEPAVVIEKKTAKDFTVYHLPHFINSFNTDTSTSSLTRFMQKLEDLKKGKKRKVRIGYFGDSMIESDLLTQTFRKLLQQEFSGSGVGFLPISSPTAKLRITATDNYSAGWQEENFKTSSRNNRLFLSGYLFKGNNDWVEMRDRCIRDSSASIEKYLLHGYTDVPITVNVNGKNIPVPAKVNFGKLLLEENKNPYLKLTVTDNRLPVYGISFETGSGIIVDNFSFRGISGVEFGTIDTSFLSSVAKENNYDLIILQYGVNVLFKPNDRNFNWYAQMLMPVVKKLKTCFNQTDFLIVSTADRAFRYDGAYQSAVGIDSLIKVQATIAYETGSAFYNQYQTMGGHNSIVRWAEKQPSLANKDYVHPNWRGADTLAHYFFNALMRDYNKYALTSK